MTTMTSSEVHERINRDEAAELQRLDVARWSHRALISAETTFEWSAAQHVTPTCDTDELLAFLDVRTVANLECRLVLQDWMQAGYAACLEEQVMEEWGSWDLARWAALERFKAAHLPEVAAEEIAVPATDTGSDASPNVGIAAIRLIGAVVECAAVSATKRR